MKTIVLLSFDFPPLSGGISRLCHELAKQLSFTYPNGLIVLTENFAGLSIDPSCETIRTLRLTSTRPIKEWRAYRYLRQLPASIIICATWYPEGLIALLSRKHKVVILAHGTEILPAKSKIKRFFWNIFSRWVLAKSDLVIANSRFTATLAKEISPQCTVEALPLAVDVQRFLPTDKKLAKALLKLTNKVTLFTVARLHRYKGVETIIEAISLLTLQEKEKIQYLVAGTGPYLKSLVEKVKVLKLESQVKFLGSLTDNKLVEFYQASDLFLLCSWQEKSEQNVEGFGLVFLEAQACGTPVVGTKSGGIPDAVEHACGGWLILEKDTQQLLQYLKRFIANPDELTSQGLLARDRVLKNFTWKTYLEKFLYLCEKHLILKQNNP
ncbi:MAG: glycosyltransferase family 4 protein [Pseudomonadota bacterium]|nr:glycosyltransferase family 4 protein [Pseudomonadota bacterium]